MPRVPDLVGRLRLDTSDLTKAEAKVKAFAASTTGSLGGLDKGLGRFQATIGKTGEGLTEFGKKASLMASVPIVAGLGLATRSAVEFDRQMQNVNSIARLSADELSRTSDAVVDLSQNLPQSASTLAAGLYDIASSGFAGRDGLIVLKAAAEAASAGLTNTATSAKGITGVLNAYGLGAEQAGRVSDALFATVDKGVITFEDLAVGLGDFVGTSAVAGVSIEQAGAALATMTKAGVTAAEAGTSLNRVLQTLIQPGEALQERMQQLGIDLDDLKDPAIGLSGVMERLRLVIGDDTQALAELFPEMRAFRGATALMSNDGKLYADVVGLMTDETQLLGSTQRALAEQAKSAAFQYDILRNRLEATGIEIGNELIPHLLTLGNAVEAVAEDFGDLPDAAQKVAIIGTVALAAVGPLSFLAGNVLKVRAALDLMTAAAARQSLAAGAGAATAAKLAGSLSKIGLAGAGLFAVGQALQAIGLYADEANTKVDELAAATGKELVAEFERAAEGPKSKGIFRFIDAVRKPIRDLESDVLGAQRQQEFFNEILSQSPTEAQRLADALKAAGTDTAEFQAQIDRAIEGNAKASIAREKDAAVVDKAAGSLRGATGATNENSAALAGNASAWTKAGGATDEMRKKVEAALGASEELIQAEFAQADALARFTDASRAVVDAERDLTEAREDRGDATRDAISIERALNAVEDAQSNVVDKEKELAKARAGRGEGAREITDAMRALKDAQQEYNAVASKGAGRDKERAAERLSDAQQRLADAQAEGGREGDVAKATEALSRAQLDARDAALSLSEAREQAAEREAAAVERIRSAEDALSNARRTAVSESVALATATRALAVLQDESVGKTVEAEARYRLLRDELIRVKDSVAPGSELHNALLGIIDTLPPPEVKFKIVAEIQEAMENLALMARAQEALGVKLPFGLDFTKNKKFHTGGLVPGSGEVPAVLRSGEFVIRDDMVRRLGVDFLARLNAGRLPRFHEGGLVTPSLRVPQLAAAGGAPPPPRAGDTHQWSIQHQDADYIVGEVIRRLDWRRR